MSLLWPLVLLFWISGDVSSGFQTQSGFCLIYFFAEANVMYIPQDPPLVLHIQTSWWSPHSRSLPTCMCRGGTWLGFVRAITWTEDEHATIVSATRLAQKSITFVFTQITQCAGYKIVDNWRITMLVNGKSTNYRRFCIAHISKSVSVNVP